MHSDILHPSRANISKEELREKLGGLYKAQKDQVQVFGLRTQFGGGKTTGFALIYDSPEAMKKFEPNYRLVRVGMATKAERASRQQRMFSPWPADDCRIGVEYGTDTPLQASSARTDKRRCAARQRSRVPRRRRTNKRADFHGRCKIRGSVWSFGIGHSANLRVLARCRHEGLVDDSPLAATGGARVYLQYTSMKSTVFGIRTTVNSGTLHAFGRFACEVLLT